MSNNNLKRWVSISKPSKRYGIPIIAEWSRNPCLEIPLNAPKICTLKDDEATEYFKKKLHELILKGLANYTGPKVFVPNAPGPSDPRFSDPPGVEPWKAVEVSGPPVGYDDEPPEDISVEGSEGGPPENGAPTHKWYKMPQPKMPEGLTLDTNQDLMPAKCYGCGKATYQTRYNFISAKKPVLCDACKEL